MKDNNINESMLTSLPDYKSQLIEIIKSNLSPNRMREKILEYHKNDIAATLENLNREDREKLYRLFDTQTLADILEYADSITDYILELSILKRVEIFSRLEVNTAVECLHLMSKSERATLIELIPDDTKREIILLSSFDDNEIGSKMSTNYICISNDNSVRDAMKQLVSQAAQNDNISTVFIAEPDATFVGAVDLKDLIIARETVKLADIIMSSYPYVYANEPIDECIERIKGYSEDLIPVLDSDNKLRGVLTSQDIAELALDIFGDDYAKFAGLTAEEDLNEPLKKSISKRLPWLVILLALGLVVSGVVGAFENVISSLSIIVSFQSLILGMAGNAGTQSLAVTIRVLMDEQVDCKKKMYLVLKEARVGFTNGVLLGTLSFFIIGVYLAFVKSNPITLSFSVSLCTCIALIISMLLSSISGTTIPLIFKKFGIDPAVASGPLITTTNDLVAVVSYYGLVWVLLL